MPKLGLFFAALCVVALAALIFFAQSAATQAAPAYSTWNSNPEGAKLLFDGLQEAGFVHVSRQFQPVEIQKPHDATVLFLGVSPYILDNQDSEFFDSMESAAEGGNSLVIAITEASVLRFREDKEKHLLQKRWGVDFPKDGVTVDKNWKQVSGLDDVWQRAFGKGTITLVAKGQRLSNKSIGGNAADRQLLYRLVSHRPSVVFEEAHLGIEESGSVVGLARHYHLQGLMLGFILLAGLFVWSRSVSFPPPRSMQEMILLGSDTRGVLTELMSRYLKGHLIAACVTEWNRTRGIRPALDVPAEVSSVAAYKHLQDQNSKYDRNFR